MKRTYLDSNRDDRLHADLSQHPVNILTRIHGRIEGRPGMLYQRASSR